VLPLVCGNVVVGRKKLDLKYKLQGSE